jgi:hypothetical protein
MDKGSKDDLPKFLRMAAPEMDPSGENRSDFKVKRTMGKEG